MDPELIPGLFPYGFWKELAALLKLAWPLSLSLTLQYILQPISTAFCGQLGKTQLAASSLAMTVIYICVISIGRGLGYGGDTFFSQTYGSENKKNVGIYLQKGIIFCCLWCMPMIGILLNAEKILLLLGQDPEVTSLAQMYINVFCPGTLAYSCCNMIIRYLLCQNKVIAVSLIYLIGVACSIAMNYLLVYVAELGIRGPSLALCLTYYLILVLLLLYIKLSGLYVHTWDGWSFQCLEAWGEFSYITTSSIVMGILYYMVFLLGTFLAGLISPVDLSSYYITFEMVAASAMITLGFSGACTARFGQYLGANKPRGAVNTARVTLLTIVILSAMMAALFLGLRFYIPLLFTHDKEVINKTSSLMLLSCIYILLEGCSLVIVGVIRATGKNTVGIIIILLSYYVIACPVEIPLTIATKLGSYGLWISLDIGILVRNVLSVIFFLRCDWSKEAEKALRRSEVGKRTASNSESKFNPHEKTSLLESGKSNSSFTSKETCSYRKQNYKRNIILKRLLVTLVFAAPLVIGLFTRLYVQTHTTNITDFDNRNYFDNNNTISIKLLNNSYAFG